jgi:hypothetical protein
LEEENMKKLLSLLGAAGLIATGSATVVSCGDPDKGTSNNNDNNDDKEPKALTYTWDQIFSEQTPTDDGKYDLGPVKSYISANDKYDEILGTIGNSFLLHIGLFENVKHDLSLVSALGEIGFQVIMYEKVLTIKDTNLEKNDDGTGNFTDGEQYYITYEMPEDFVYTNDDLNTITTIKATTTPFTVEGTITNLNT